ncbi:glycosyltransferase [Zhouia spongiae]|uniref:Glycosyltransferase n=1 Tax=Zhouia spongiae TaxID=2202721 RepID=A0ABY3YGT3_9FLAO|nr:glycosyltransferase [Zhouia spongiae]UNY97214.1 glycosyltransferase [Zhouia spongiae]
MTTPSRKKKNTIKLMIVIGLITVVNFFYRFLDSDQRGNELLFWLLFASFAMQAFGILYMWYHYWNLSIPRIKKTSKKYTVDVLTTYFPGEPYEMTTKTLLAMKNIKYPHTTYLCDEANDPFLKQFCRENDIVHVSRNNRIDAKAGNINNALKQATGELCVILDPDHVPVPEMLDEVIAYFDDEKIGYVQSVQAYYNQSESLVAKGAAEQTYLFYGPMMMCMNSYGTVNAIGANCIFRREALDSIGGHAAGLCEDMHTAMQLHAKKWTSIYHPKILTKGLVPASLTAYYKQQLKWSRGCFELLITSYPKLFRHLSLRQKIHYGLIPFHYLLGFVFLLNFLIPIISLITAKSPWSGNIMNFSFMLLPLLMSIVCIHLYIQQWLIEKKEKGLHLTGGLLLCCTWWVLIIGTLYTFIRKKVPYLPTPKEGKDKTSFLLVVPNLVIAFISIAAIVYGLVIDLTPFSIFMACFCLFNTLCMLYTLFFAYGKFKSVSFIPESQTSKRETKKIKTFSTLQKLAFPVLALTLLSCSYLQYRNNFIKWDGAERPMQQKNVINYFGIFSPAKNDGISSIRNIVSIEEDNHVNFDIISLYLAWNKDQAITFPYRVLDSIYKSQSIPMITWEPWLNDFQLPDTENKHVIKEINKGRFDQFIIEFARILRNYDRPVFLRFAHEFDNPGYPWYSKDRNAPDEFKKAWVHTYNLFKNEKANNVIWIWNPWKAKNISAFYPGKSYVDWIGVNILDYGPQQSDSSWLNFNELYAPYHKELRKLPNTPVIISELGTLKKGNEQTKWINEAHHSIAVKYNEIKSAILFDSNQDKNLPKKNNSVEKIDWKIMHHEILRNWFSNRKAPGYVFNKLKSRNSDTPLFKKNDPFRKQAIRGVNIKKGHRWYRDYHVLSRENILKDLKGIKQLNMNTVRYISSDIYDYNILNITREERFNVAYSFWIPSNIDFINDTVQTKELSAHITDKVSQHRDQQHIISWNFQNDVLTDLKNYYHKPELLFQQIAFLKWLGALSQKIKEEDPARPLLIDMEITEESIYFSELIKKYAPDINTLGLLVNSDTKQLDHFEKYARKHHINYIYNEIDVASLLKLNPKESYFIENWQDQHESNKLSFDGLIDRKGRYKRNYYSLLNVSGRSPENLWTSTPGILKPSVLIFEGESIAFRAMLYSKEEGWFIPEKDSDITFEWSLVKCDSSGNLLAVKDLGTGRSITLEVPENHDNYRICLTSVKNGIVDITFEPLNTPLLEGEMLAY